MAEDGLMPLLQRLRRSSVFNRQSTIEEHCLSKTIKQWHEESHLLYPLVAKMRLHLLVNAPKSAG